MRKCNSESTPLGVTTVSQTSSSWAAGENLSPLGTVPPESCHITGGGRSLDIRRNFKTVDEKVMNHPRSLESGTKNVPVPLRLCHLFTVSLGYIDQSALGSNRGLTMLSCADAVGGDSVQVKPKDLHREPEEKA